MKVIKRDGTTVDFDPQKIVVAIEKANAAVEEQCRISESKIKEIAAYVQGKKLKLVGNLHCQSRCPVFVMRFFHRHR